MTRIAGEIRIQAPRERVWDVLADIGAVANYHPGVARAYYVSEEREGIGATRRCELYPNGSIDETVTAWRPGESYTIEMVRSTAPFKQVVAWLGVRPVGNETAVRLAVKYTLKFGLVGLLMDRLLVRRNFTKMVPAVLAGLKYHIETGRLVEDRVPALQAA
ncbi:MAG: SRPBCC family protein [Chloroflexi bacterium]|nr:SRPBCC family protein [Chloroflexota bacterium]